MKLRIVFLRSAELEVEQAYDYYEEQESGLGRAFRESIEHGIELIRSGPLAYPLVVDPEVCRFVVDRFPFIIVYSVEVHCITIISIFHTSRDPMIWQKRID